MSLFVEPEKLEFMTPDEIDDFFGLEPCIAGIYPHCLKCFVANGEHILVCPYAGKNRQKLLAAGFKQCEGH